MEQTTENRNWRVVVKYPLESVLCVLLVAVVVVTFIQVLFRYVLQLSLAWSEELARFIFMWLAALASAYAFKTKAHFALRFLVNLLGKGAKKFTATLVMLILTVFMVLFIVKAYEYTMSVTNQIAPGTQISMAIPYSSAVVGGVMMLYYILRNWWTEMKALSEKTDQT